MTESASFKKKPSHVAVIMDGNGRWAKKRLLPRAMGHRAGMKRVNELVRSCVELGIQTLTIYAFSSENWLRPKNEVSTLMGLFLEALKNEVKELHENQVKMNFVGDLSQLSKPLQTLCAQTVELMQHNTGLQLNVAMNYGSYWDITAGAKKLAEHVKAGKLEPSEINEDVLFDAMPSSASVPAVDLLIRTSGEQRISNFLLWQLSYAELYFTDVNFPDFDRQALEAALAWYAKKERRFGQTSEQLTC